MNQSWFRNVLSLSPRSPNPNLSSIQILSHVLDTYYTPTPYACHFRDHKADRGTFSHLGLCILKEGLDVVKNNYNEK